jgi:hypothetical protein
MSTPAPFPRTAGAPAAGDTLAAAEGCPACPHPMATHDVVDARFCRATAARGLSRGCTCARR